MDVDTNEIKDHLNNNDFDMGYFEHCLNHIKKMTQIVLFNIEGKLKKIGFDAIWLKGNIDKPDNALFHIIEGEINRILKPLILKTKTIDFENHDFLSRVLTEITIDEKTIFDYILCTYMVNSTAFDDLINTIKIFFLGIGFDNIYKIEKRKDKIDNLYNIVCIENEYEGLLNGFGLTLSTNGQKNVLIHIIQEIILGDFLIHCGKIRDKESKIINELCKTTKEDSIRGYQFFLDNIDAIKIYTALALDEEDIDVSGNDKLKRLETTCILLHNITFEDIKKNDNILGIYIDTFKIYYKYIITRDRGYESGRVSNSKIANFKKIHTIYKNTLKEKNIDIIIDEIRPYIMTCVFFIEILESANTNVAITLSQVSDFLLNIDNKTLRENAGKILLNPYISDFYGYDGWFFYFDINKLRENGILPKDLIDDILKKKLSKEFMTKRKATTSKDYKIGLIFGSELSAQAFGIYINDPRNTNNLHGFNQDNFTTLCHTFKGQGKLNIDKELSHNIYKFVIVFELDHETHLQKNTIKKFPTRIIYGTKPKQHFSKDYFEELLELGLNNVGL